MADPIDTDAIRASLPEWNPLRMEDGRKVVGLCDEVDRLRAENAALKAQQCPHNSKTFGQCIVCGWTGLPTCSECGEPIRLDRECCSTCGAWENAVEDRVTAADDLRAIPAVKNQPPKETP